MEERKVKRKSGARSANTHKLKLGNNTSRKIKTRPIETNVHESESFELDKVNSEPIKLDILFEPIELDINYEPTESSRVNSERIELDKVNFEHIDLNKVKSKPIGSDMVISELNELPAVKSESDELNMVDPLDSDSMQSESFEINITVKSEPCDDTVKPVNELDEVIPESFVLNTKKSEPSKPNILRVEQEWHVDLECPPAVLCECRQTLRGRSRLKPHKRSCSVARNTIKKTRQRNLSIEEKKLKKKEYNRKRWERLKSSTESLELLRQKERLKYLKKKEKGHVKSIKSMSAEEALEKRKQWKHNSKVYREKTNDILENFAKFT